MSNKRKGHPRKAIALLLACAFALAQLASPITAAAISGIDYSGFEFKADRLFRDSEADAGARVDSIIDNMTLTEKMAMNTGGTAGAVARLGLGGGVGTGSGAGDVHHGTQSGTWFPNSLGLSQAWDLDLFSRIGDLMGKEGGNGGVGGSHSMVVDILRDPRYGRASETYGEDGFLAGKLMAAVTTGMTKRDENGYTGYRPMLKHFMGYNTETMRTWVNSSMPLRSMYEYHIMSFYYPIKAGGAKSVMTSYPLVNGKPMAVSHTLGKLLTEWTPNYVSKEEGGDGATGHFEFVNTDDYGSGSSIFYNSQRYFYDDFLGRTIGFSYGAKMGNKGWSLRNAGGQVNHIWEGLARGIITEEDITDSAKRNLAVAVREGQFDQLGSVRSSQWQNRNMTKAALRELPSSKGLTLEASQSGIVMLKNDANILPLKGAEMTDVVLLGMQSDTVLYEYYARGYNYRITIKDAFENKLGKDNVHHDRAVDTVAIKASNGLYLEGGTSLAVKPNNATPVRAIQDTKPTLANMKTNPAAFEIYDYGYDKLIRTPVNGLYVQTNRDEVSTARGSPWTWYNDNVGPGGENENVTTSPEWRSDSTLHILPTPDGKYGFYAPNAGCAANIPPSLTGGVQRPGTMSVSDADVEEFNDGSYLAINGLADLDLTPGIRNVAGQLTPTHNTTGMGTTDRVEVLFSSNGPWQNQDNVRNSPYDIIPDDGMIDNLPENAKFEFDVIQSAKEAAKAQIDAASPNAPIVLVLGIDPGLGAREGSDYTYLGLGDQQVELIKYLANDLGKDIILVLKMANPMAVQREVADIPGVKAILTFGHCGPEEGPGLVSVLYDDGYSVPLEGDWGPRRDSTAGRITTTVSTYSSYPGYRGPAGDGVIPGRSPAGRLSATWYDGEGQMKGGMDAWTYAPASILHPPFDEDDNNNFSNTNGTIPGGLQVYDIIKGERTYQYLNSAPLFAFGHGLSYGDFAYSNVAVSAVTDTKDHAARAQKSFTVTGRVTNNGARAADEVVQIYSSFLNGASSRIAHHNKRLVGFERLYGIAPGETRNFSIVVTNIVDELGVYDVESDRKVVENGSYRIVAAGTSEFTVAAGNNATLAITSANGGTALPPRNLNRLVMAESFDDYSDIGGKVMDIEIVAAAQEDYDCNYAASFRENGAWIKFGNVAMAANMNRLTASIGSDRAGEMKVYALPVGADPSALATATPIAALTLSDTRAKQGLPPGMPIGPVPGHASSPLGRTTDDNYILPQMKVINAAVSVAAGTYDIYFVSEPRGARFEWFKFGNGLDNATGGTIFDTYKYDSIRQPLGTLQLRAELAPATAADSITWSVTSGGAYATINAATGLLSATGAGNGTVTVRAACSGGAAISKDIMVTNQLASDMLMVGTTPKAIEYLVFAAVTDNIARYRGSATLNVTYFAPTDPFPTWSGDYRGQYAAGFTFSWTTLAAANLTFSVTDLDGGPTGLATVSNNVVTATGAGNGKVKVTAALNVNPDIKAERIVHITNQEGNDAYTLIHPIEHYDTAVAGDITGTLAAPGATAAWTGASYTAATPFVPSQAGSVAAMTANQVLLFRDVDFGPDGTNEVVMNLAGTGNANVSLYLDRTDAQSGGTHIGTVRMTSTGALGTYRNFGTPLNQIVTGKHNLFLVFSGTARLAYFQFASDLLDENDTTEISSTLDSAAPIVSGIFGEPGASQFDAARELVAALAPEPFMPQATVDAARAALIDAIGGLTIGDGYAQYGELAELLVEIALIDGLPNEGNPAWEALMQVYEEAWQFIASHAGLADIAPLSIDYDIGALAEYFGDEFEALATIDPAILEMLRRLNEAYYEFLYGGEYADHEFGDEIDTGVDADDATFYLNIEDWAKPGFGAKFTVHAKDFYDVSYVHLRFSYETALYEAGYALSAYLAANSFEIDLDDSEDDGDLTYVSMYLRHETPGSIVAGGPDIELLDVWLKPVPNNVPAARPASLALEHIDIVYYDSPSSIDADVYIDPSVAAAYIYYYSIYDINRDGKVTLADVDIVRRNIGKDPTTSSDPLVVRSNVDNTGASAGVIDFADLHAVIAAYEATL